MSLWFGFRTAGTGTYTFASGVTETAGNVTNDLITGKAGGQTIIGSTLTGETLTLRPNGANTTTGQVIIGATTASTSKTTGSLKVLGGIGIAGALFANEATITAGFGCNSKTAQTAYASGGALATYGTGAFGFDSDAHASELHAMVVSIRAALVANGIMS